MFRVDSPWTNIDRVCLIASYEEEVSTQAHTSSAPPANSSRVNPAQPIGGGDVRHTLATLPGTNREREHHPLRGPGARTTRPECRRLRGAASVVDREPRRVLVGALGPWRGRRRTRRRSGARRRPSDAGREVVSGCQPQLRREPASSPRRCARDPVPRRGPGPLHAQLSSTARRGVHGFRGIARGRSGEG